MLLDFFFSFKSFAFLKRYFFSRIASKSTDPKENKFHLMIFFFVFLVSCRTKEAEAMYQRALEFDDSNPDLYFNVSCICCFSLLHLSFICYFCICFRYFKSRMGFFKPSFFMVFEWRLYLVNNKLCWSVSSTFEFLSHIHKFLCGSVCFSFVMGKNAEKGFFLHPE